MWTDVGQRFSRQGEAYLSLAGSYSSEELFRKVFAALVYELHRMFRRNRIKMFISYAHPDYDWPDSTWQLRCWNRIVSVKVKTTVTCTKTGRTSTVPLDANYYRRKTRMEEILYLYNYLTYTRNWSIVIKALKNNPLIFAFQKSYIERIPNRKAKLGKEESWCSSLKLVLVVERWKHRIRLRVPKFTRVRMKEWRYLLTISIRWTE